jgi:hypothetical protein
LSAYDNFDDRYLGQKSSNPSVDNDGNALLTGALYFNTVDNAMRVYTGSVWVDAYAAGQTFLAKANNLSDLTNVATARQNLDLEIGVDVQAYDATILKSADIGVTVQGYDADTPKYDDTIANFSGTLQNGGHTVLTTASDYLDSADIGVTVQGYDATIVVDADIGVTVQGYDADTVKYDDVNPTFTDTGAIKVPVGSDSERPGTPVAGQFRFNNDSDEFEGYDGTAWGAIGGGGGGLSWQSVQTSNFNASAGNAYPVNTTSAEITATLPASPSAGQIITFVDYAGTWDTNRLTLALNGNKLNGIAADFQISGTERGAVNLVYIDSTQGWITYAGYTGTPSYGQIYSIDYLVIAGGGGGGRGSGGGGGAGGYRTSAGTTGGGGSAESQAQISLATNYTVTVGAGGAGTTSGDGTNSPAASSGSDSVFSSVTSTGGGGAGSRNTSSAEYDGKTGGSGGGGSVSATITAAGTGGTATSSPAQGYDGGDGSISGSGAGCGGGGGAGALGSDGSNSNGGNGGAGLASSITGSSVTRGGGGGGGAYTSGGGTAGTGGSGGGGNGTNNSSTASAGTVNTGGGGGGGGIQDGGGRGNGGAGGSGLVILKYPDTLTISNPGGGLTLSTAAPSGGFKVTTITAGTGNVSWS